MTVFEHMFISNVRRPAHVPLFFTWWVSFFWKTFFKNYTILLLPSKFFADLSSECQTNWITDEALHFREAWSGSKLFAKVINGRCLLTKCSNYLQVPHYADGFNYIYRVFLQPIENASVSEAIGENASFFVKLGKKYVASRKIDVFFTQKDYYVLFWQIRVFF